MDNNDFQEFMADQFAKLFGEIQTFKQDVKSEFSDVRSELSGAKSELSDVKSRLTSVEHSQARLETNLTRKIDALYFDFRETQKQFNAEVTTKIEELSTKVEALEIKFIIHDKEIKDLKRVLF
ncbi:hypothetical protein REC12_12850 [Desulfosporosinus sp. PR]|uniref:hypothetical protein n=1 Tax=Candidatus Desulfosporosinus nitrosoreducens TaxID=3401928 RepID=UPI0027E6B535|nr:hypothetical protein [Desulfosporosinus sp. PR]MDQ7094479.1 hypothetical protein [Desulfosporosinus sp. PR]